MGKKDQDIQPSKSGYVINQPKGSDSGKKKIKKKDSSGNSSNGHSNGTQVNDENHLAAPGENSRFIPPESKSAKYIRTRQSVADAHWTDAMNQFKRPSVLNRSLAHRK